METKKFTYSEYYISVLEFKQKALAWANQYQVVAFYEDNKIPFPYGGFANLLAVSNTTALLVDPVIAFEDLHQLIQKSKTLICGILGYDLKNQIEKLCSSHPDLVGFPMAYFFEPEIYIYFGEADFEIYAPPETAEEVITQILGSAILPKISHPILVQPRVQKQQYLESVRAIQNHILEGDVYEINFCQEFYAVAADINPVTSFWALNDASPMPFAGFFKLQNKFLLCASPERSLKKQGNKLISQPIKGTSKRNPDKNLDEQLREQLRHSEKEIAENMMIMDLVRNDLSKSSVTGSVQVEEMFGIYGFKHLYQMITTVTSEIKPGLAITEAIKNAFPMGSMTGAPKIKAMELIEQYEITRRGLFSGSLGYIKPTGDFDFNVVIRSIQFNADTQYLSFMVGSAITYDADPEQEYAECMLKAEAILNILKN